MTSFIDWLKLIEIKRKDKRKFCLNLFFSDYTRNEALFRYKWFKYLDSNLIYFHLQENYDNTFLKHVYECPVVTYDELRRGLVKTKDPIRIQYNTKDQYKRTAKMLGLMDDFKVSVFSFFIL